MVGMSNAPPPRGEISELLLAALRRPPHPIDHPQVASADPLRDEDLQLALYCCYELFYRGFADIDDGWEWNPSLIAFRASLEDAFDDALRDAVVTPEPEGFEPEEMDLALRAIAESDDAPSLSRYIERARSLAQFHEFMIHRSAYQLKEADPHTWAIPR